MNAASSGREVTGILVADPDSADATTRPLAAAGTTGTTQNADTHNRYSDGDQKVTDKHQTVFSLRRENC